MNQYSDILKHVDHTLLKQEATWEQIKEICDDGMKYQTASVCIPPCFVQEAKSYMEECYNKEGTPKEEQTKICTVIGFPNGYSTTKVKEAETKEALLCGADEIDMVINITDLKAGRYDKVEGEIRALKEVCGENILKVIVETCLLTTEEKIKMCELVTNAGADYIKTSTGFSTAGATFEDVKLFSEHVGSNVKIKAAGGISGFQDAEEFLRLGAERLGTSRLVNLVKKMEEKSKASPVSDSMLVSIAKLARKNSYAPYSGFRVGAALLTKEGKVYTGCNVENASYSMTNCAERSAFFRAVSDGERNFSAIAIVGGKDEDIDDYTAPCGACRQVMMEFCNPDAFRIILCNKKGELLVKTLAELLPMGFGPDNLA